MLIKAHAGEDHVPQTNETYQDVVNRIKAQFIDNDNKLLVIVVNPFWHDLDLAWKAFRNLVAYLQNSLSQQVAGQQQPLAIKDACYAAANILFHLPQKDFERYFININPLFQNLAEAQLIYDTQATEPEQSFRWKNCTDVNAAAKFNRDFKSALGRIVDSHQGDRVLLQNLMRGLENSMLVLSHVDLATQLKSIEIQDFDKVINLIFANPNSSYRRQLLAKNFTLHVGYAENGEIEIRPSELLTETASQFYENIKSFAIEPETAEPLSAAPVEESEKTPPVDLAPLIVATESLVKEIAFLRESLASQMQEGVSQDELVNEVKQLTKLAQAHKEISQAHKKMSLESFDLLKKLQAQESDQKASDQEQTRLIQEQTQLIKEQSRLISQKTPQSSVSQPQSSSNSQGGLLWLFIIMILIASVFLVSQISRLESQLNNEVIASNVASKVPDALKDKGVTTEIIEQLNLNKVEIDEEKLSKLIATTLSSQDSNFIAQLATEVANKMPAIESEKVTNAIAANLADTPGKAVEQVTKD